MSSDKRLIVALDFDNMDKVEALVTSLGNSVSYYKVGMELYYSVGSQVISYLKNQGKEVFLDLKLHDIPNTVAKGLSALTGLGASMLNVHASGGAAMMKLAAEAVKTKAAEMGVERPKLIAVTILTSMSEEEWSLLGYDVNLAEQVINFAKLAKNAGMDGVVASPQEAEKIRAACGEDFIIVTPGVRPAGSAVNDQSRIATPSGALKNGASYLVIGRPITAAENPKTAANAIIQEMRDC